MMEMINDIVREMRDRAEAMEIHGTPHGIKIAIKEFADRIEQAVVRENRTSKESLQVGNAAKMREVLEWFWSKRSMLDFCHNNLSTKTWEDWDKVYYFLRELADKVQTALSAPPRNCDLYTKDEVRLVYHLHGDGLMTMQAFSEWLFAEAKGEAK